MWSGFSSYVLSLGLHLYSMQVMFLTPLCNEHYDVMHSCAPPLLCLAELVNSAADTSAGPRAFVDMLLYFSQILLIYKVR